ESFRASELPGRSRVAAWSDLLAARLDKVEFTAAAGEAFEGELRLHQLGPLGIARLDCGAGSMVRAPRHIGHTSVRTYAFILHLKGSARFAQSGHEAALHEGAVALCATGAPYALPLDDGAELALLRAPAPILKEHLPTPEYFCGRRLAARDGVT